MTNQTFVERRIRIGDVLVDYDDAAQDVSVERKIVDILMATPGDDLNCMNSLCIRAQRNHHVFPHPVYAVSTIRTRVYIVDQLNDLGGFSHCIRYELSAKDSRLINEHDKYGSAEPGTLTLRVPRDPKGSPKRSATGGGRFSDGAGHGQDLGKPYAGIKNRPVTSGRGAAGRFKVAVGALNDSGASGDH